jgi:hypothetical protein
MCIEEESGAWEGFFLAQLSLFCELCTKEINNFLL